MADMENGFLEGNGIIILLLFFLMFGWGGNGFGFGYNNAAAQGAVTRAEMQDGFNNAEIQRNQSDIKDGLCGINQQIMQNRYDMALGNAGISQAIAENRYAAALQAQAAQGQLATCCCDLKTAVHAEGEATRAMIQQQTIDDLKYQLTQANTAVSNAVQTQNLVNQMQGMMASMGRWVANPPMPYAQYNYGNYGGNCGCGCGNGF